MNLATRLLACLTFVGLSAALLAADKAADQPRFLAKDALDVAALLPPPPAAESAEASAELAVVLHAQESRTAADIARAKSEDKLTLAAFTPAVGPWFTPQRLPRLVTLLARIDVETKAISKPAKQTFNHPRPAATDKRVNPIIDESDASYPSGHSTRATLYAVVLAEILPEDKAQLMARAQEIGWDRIIAGVHYPSDVEAGRVLGLAIAHNLLANPAFRAELDQARAEINAARATMAAAKP